MKRIARRDMLKRSGAAGAGTIGFRVFTHENVYSLSSENARAGAVDGGLDVTCTELIWAGGQQRAPGRLVAHLRKRDNAIECAATVEMERPIKAVALILRGVPRGRLSAGGAHRRRHRSVRRRRVLPRHRRRLGEQPETDMHDGTRRLVADLRRRFPNVAVVGEMHYDALLEFMPMYHSFGQTIVADLVQRHAKFFQHLSHPAPGRGSSGVHESGFGRWNPQTLSLTDTTIPTLNVVDDTFDKYRAEMDAVIQEAKRRV